MTAEKAKTVLTLKKFFSGLKQKQVHWAYQSTMRWHTQIEMTWLKTICEKPEKGDMGSLCIIS